MERFVIFMIIFIILLIGVISFYLDVFRNYSGDGLITSKRAVEMIDNNKIKYVIDVRTEREWQMGHYKGAIHIPLDNLDNDMYLPSDYKTSGILLYCRTGRRAKKGYEILKNINAKKVYYINGSYKTLN